MSQNRFLLKWENGTTKQSFGPSSKLPLRLCERNTLAAAMTFEQIADTGEFVQDEDTRRKHKWKAVRNFYSVTRQEKYKNCSFEKALWTHAGTNVTSHHFVAAMIAELTFDQSMYYDKQLRNMYFSFEGGKHDKADWRDILATFKILVYFRLVKEEPLELILLLFDVYTTGDKQGRALKKEYHVLQNASEIIRRICIMPCILSTEIGIMDSKLVDLFHVLKAEREVITRGAFKRLLDLEEHRPIVKLFAKYAWDRLPTELRLTAFDEAQMRHHDNAEALLMRHKLSQAIMMYNKSIMRIVYREWKMEMLREAGVRNFVNRILYRSVFFWAFRASLGLFTVVSSFGRELVPPAYLWAHANIVLTARDPWAAAQDLGAVSDGPHAGRRKLTDNTGTAILLLVLPALGFQVFLLNFFRPRVTLLVLRASFRHMRCQYFVVEGQFIFSQTDTHCLAGYLVK
jgi:hypothetical protein